MRTRRALSNSVSRGTKIVCAARNLVLIEMPWLMQTERLVRQYKNEGALKRQFILDWLLPLMGLGVALAWEVMSSNDQGTRALNGVARILYVAASSDVVARYLWVVAVWWSWRLWRHGNRRDSVMALALMLQMAGLYYLVSADSRVAGVLLTLGGLAVMFVTPDRDYGGDKEPRRTPGRQ